MKSLACLCITLAALQLDGREIVALSPEGDSVVIEVQPYETFEDTVKAIEATFGAENGFYINFQKDDNTDVYFRKAKDKPKKKDKTDKVPLRDYNVLLTNQDFADLKMIITTLGKGWGVALVKQKKLKEAGKRIDHLHPFRFLEAIFTDEQMKAVMAGLESQAFVWDGFFESDGMGLIPSSEHESNRGNMGFDISVAFANSVGVNVDLIWPYVHNRDWKGLVRSLIAHVPRNTNTKGINI